MSIFKENIELPYLRINGKMGFPFYTIPIQYSHIISFFHKVTGQVAGQLFYPSWHIHIMGPKMSYCNPHDSPLKSYDCRLIDLQASINKQCYIIIFSSC